MKRRAFVSCTVGAVLFLGGTSAHAARIAFEVSGDDRASRASRGIYTIRTDGNRERRLTSGDDYEPQWSPDHRFIAFQRAVYRETPVGRFGNTSLYVMRSDGSAVRRLATGSRMSWAPDSRRLACVCTPEGSTSGLHVIDRRGRVLRKLEGSRAISPAWSPDGTAIAYSMTTPMTDYDIYTIAPDGTDRRRLTTDPGMDYQPVWSNDSRRIAFGSDRDQFDGGDGIYISDVFAMDVDGTNETRLTDDCSYDTPAAWAGHRVLYRSHRNDDGCRNPAPPQIRSVSDLDGSMVILSRWSGSLPAYLESLRLVVHDAVTDLPGDPEGAEIVLTRLSGERVRSLTSTASRWETAPDG